MVDISKIGYITNIPEPLLKYRLHDKQITSSKHNEQQIFRNQIQLRQLSAFQINPSVEEVIIHLNLMNKWIVPKSQLLSYEKWCNKLLTKNAKLNIYKQEYLFSFLEEKLSKAIDLSF